MTFGYGQLSKFVQCPGIVHSEGEDRVILYVRATYDQGISYYVLGPDKRNKLGEWVDTDFASHIDSRKSMTVETSSLSLEILLQVFK